MKAYTCIEIGSGCCSLHVKFDHPINQNDDVPMHVVQNIGTGMPQRQRTNSSENKRPSRKKWLGDATAGEFVLRQK